MQDRAHQIADRAERRRQRRQRRQQQNNPKDITEVEADALAAALDRAYRHGR